jgi:hypothetical protein
MTLLPPFPTTTTSSLPAALSISFVLKTQYDSSGFRQYSPQQSNGGNSGFVTGSTDQRHYFSGTSQCLQIDVRVFATEGVVQQFMNHGQSGTRGCFSRWTTTAAPDKTHDCIQFRQKHIVATAVVAVVVAAAAAAVGFFALSFLHHLGHHSFVLLPLSVHVKHAPRQLHRVHRTFRGLFGMLLHIEMAFGIYTAIRDLCHVQQPLHTTTVAEQRRKFTVQTIQQMHQLPTREDNSIE